MSGDSGAKITVEADTRSVEAGAEKIGRGFREAGKHARTMGEELEHAGGHIARHVIGVGAMVKVIEEAAKAWREYQKAAAEASKTAGEGVLSRAAAGGRLGLSGNDTNALTAPGNRSRKESTDFLGQLAALNTGNYRVSRQDTFRASALDNSRLFESSEIIEAVKEGRLDELLAQSGKRLADAGPEFARELEVRSIENRNAESVEDINASHDGAMKRVAASHIALRNTEHPILGGGLQSVIKGTIPFGADAIDAADSAVNSAQLTALQRIADNTASRPRLPSGGTE